MKEIFGLKFIDHWNIVIFIMVIIVAVFGYQLYSLHNEIQYFMSIQEENQRIGPPVEEEFDVLLSTTADKPEDELPDIEEIKSYLYQRIEYINRIFVKYSYDLRPENALSLDEIENRVDSVFKYAEEYNHLYPDTDYRLVGLYVTALIEHETRFVNFRSLDDGISFGVPSIRWTTVDGLSNKYDVSYNRDDIISNTDLQIRFAVLYFYDNLSRFGCTEKAIISYNLGHNATLAQERTETYYFIVKGIVSYYLDFLQ